MNAEIARSGFRLSGRDFLPCDRVDFSQFDIEQDTIDNLRGQRDVVPLTKRTYRDAMCARPGEAGLVGRGFTEGELIQLGILESSEKAAPVQAWKRPANSREHKSFVIVEKKRGRGFRYDVHNAAGQLMRPEEFVSGEAAEAYIDEISSQSTADAESGTSGAGEQNEGDGDDGDGDVRSESGGSTEPGSPEAG